ncbi:protein FAR1-RELATED SEQUENCE 6-like [Silene latifolia]|uniref:protein FAR1-RELATED SEQUENCE 6-like n=1 Tax=Silene latifolia TaxID=37657 RepID=UPI003D76A433
MDIDLNIPWEEENPNSSSEDNDSSSEDNESSSEDVDIFNIVNDDDVNDNDDDLDDSPPIVEGGWVQRVGNMLNIGGNADSLEVNPPTRGMTFVNGDEFAAYCYLYAYKNGFQIFIRTSELMKKYQERGVKRNGTGKNQTRFYMMKRIRLCCVRGAKPSKKNGFIKIPNFEKCKFVVEASLQNDVIVIGACSLEHNHELRPENTRHMVSYRMFDLFFRRRALLNDAAGISIAKNFNTLVREAGGHENLRINQRDIRNLINLERRRSRINGDAAALEERFIKLKDVDPEFYYAIEKDAKGKLLMCFGPMDVVEEWPRYKMPFTPFVGVNHHGSTVVLDAALVSHEDAESFTWVFRRWIDCMGRAPSVILTDQCKGMKKAVKNVFTSTRHRLCLWHMMMNAVKNLGKHVRYNEINVDLRKIVDDSADSDDFEEAWHHFVTKYDLKKNNWVIEAFQKRHSWVPLYWRDIFCAGMSATQRSEQTNRFFKNYVNVETTLFKFFDSYQNALRSKVEHELKLNYACLEKPSPYNKTIIAEEVFQRAYTNDIFGLVKDEVQGLIHTNAECDMNIGNFSKFTVTDEVTTPFWNRREKKFVVTSQLDFGEFTCTCKLFEFKGILCRHIIRILQLKKVQYIPDKYILSRWRKDLVRGYEHIPVGYYNPGESELLKRSLAVTMKNDYIYRLALHDDETYALYEAESAKVVKALEAHVGIETLNAIGVGSDVTKVWGRKRLQTMENNQRHMLRNAPPATEGALIDPVDKRGSGRGSRPRQRTVRRALNIDDAGPSQPTPRRRRVNTNTVRSTQ